MRYLYQKYPKATSGQLSWARSKAVCAPALAYVAVKHLQLHKMLLVNNVELSMAIGRYVPILEQTTGDDITINGWKQDPPKALSDVLESVLGAVFVDCGYDFEKASVVAETALHELLVTLTPDMPKDPVSTLMVWSARSGCRKISFRQVVNLHPIQSSFVYNLNDLSFSLGNLKVVQKSDETTAFLSSYTISQSLVPFLPQICP